jgi:archaellum biogenesis ATPase FlaH
MSLEVIADVIVKFLKQSKNPVILLDGIEHLIFENGPTPVLRLLRDIQEWIIIQRAILIVPVNPDAIEKKELALMERNMNEIGKNNIED